MRYLPAYLRIAAMWPKIAYAYRLNLLLWLLGTVLQIYLLRVVWTAVYAGREGPVEMPLDQLVAYLTLANLQMFVTFPMIANQLENRIREGQIAIDMARPVPFLGQMLAQQVGASVGLAPFALLALPLAYFLGNVVLPPTPQAALLYVVSFALSYAILTEIGLMLGLIAFWTVESWAFNAIFRFVNQFFAGGLVPLWLFPDTLRALAQLLPFQTQAHIPISIYLGQMAGFDALRGLAVLAFWVVALYVFAQMAWRGAMRRVVVQGG